MRNTILKLFLCSLLAFAIPVLHRANASQTQLTSIPMLASLSQISPNQLKVTYDQPVQAKGMDPKSDFN